MACATGHSGRAGTAVRDPGRTAHAARPGARRRRETRDDDRAAERAHRACTVDLGSDGAAVAAQFLRRSGAVPHRFGDSQLASSTDDGDCHRGGARAPRPAVQHPHRRRDEGHRRRPCARRTHRSKSGAGQPGCLGGRHGACRSRWGADRLDGLARRNAAVAVDRQCVRGGDLRKIDKPADDIRRSDRCRMHGGVSRRLSAAERVSARSSACGAGDPVVDRTAHLPASETARTRTQSHPGAGSHRTGHDRIRRRHRRLRSHAGDGAR